MFVAVHPTLALFVLTERYFERDPGRAPLMIFFCCALLLMYVGRKLGWAFSKSLYFAPVAGVLVFGLFWGIAVSVSIRGLVAWQAPGVVLRWVMGYALGSYVAIPNYGLVNEATIPPEARTRHVLLKAVPFLTYIASSIVLAFASATRSGA